jgi:hypothetical protein
MIFLTDNRPQRARYNGGMRGVNGVGLPGRNSRAVLPPMSLGGRLGVEGRSHRIAHRRDVGAARSVWRPCAEASRSLMPLLAESESVGEGRSLFTQWHRGDGPGAVPKRSSPDAALEAGRRKETVRSASHRDRHESAYQLQCYSGIAPVKQASGKTEWIHFRFTYPKFLCQTVHEFASHSIGRSEWAKAYYEHLRNDQKRSHHAGGQGFGI